MVLFRNYLKTIQFHGLLCNQNYSLTDMTNSKTLKSKENKGEKLINKLTGKMTRNLRMNLFFFLFGFIVNGMLYTTLTWLYEDTQKAPEKSYSKNKLAVVVPFR